MKLVERVSLLSAIGLALSLSAVADVGYQRVQDGHQSDMSIKSVRKSIEIQRPPFSSGIDQSLGVIRIAGYCDTCWPCGGCDADEAEREGLELRS